MAAFAFGMMGVGITSCTENMAQRKISGDYA